MAFTTSLFVMDQRVKHGVMRKGWVGIEQGHREGRRGARRTLLRNLRIAGN